MIPAGSATSLPSYAAARRAAAYLGRSDRGRILVAGRDRASYLHGLLTNDVAALKPGEGCYAAYLTPQGRLITDLWVYELGDVILLTLSQDVAPAVLARLDQFVFTEDVQLSDVTATLSAVAIVGPESARVVSTALGMSADTLAGLPEHGSVRAEFGGASAIVTHTSDLGLNGFDVYLAAEKRGPLTAALDRTGVMPLEPAAAETLRIEGGVPKFHADMDEDTIPLEAGIESRAISFTKGCYVGQEVIIRVLHRGHGRIARKLVGLVVEADAAPPAGSLVHAADREVGRVTSSTVSPLIGKPIALAYVHRDFIEPGTRLTAAGSAAVVAALPFAEGGWPLQG